VSARRLALAAARSERACRTALRPAAMRETLRSGPLAVGTSARTPRPTSLSAGDARDVLAAMRANVDMVHAMLHGTKTQLLSQALDDLLVSLHRLRASVDEDVIPTERDPLGGLVADGPGSGPRSRA
jgi:hypothetical protein